MQELLTYLLKSSGLLITFFGAYYFLLRKETFFTSNRWFLLSGLISSVVLPLFFIKKIVLIDAPKISPIHNSTSESFPIASKEIVQQAAEINWLEIGFYVYGIIAIVLLFKIIFNLFSLYKVLDKNKIQKQNDVQFIDTKEHVAPFSFFNYIVINSSLYSESELQSILLHEKIHSAQKHSVDVLLTNLFSVVFWFNPFMYLYKKAVLQNLEYIADSEAIAQIDDRKAYQMVLLKVVSNQNCLPITNHFYQSLIKKRIIMLNKNQSHRKNSWKYAVIIPALIAFVILFQVEVVAQEKEQILTKESTKNSATATLVEVRLDSNDKDEAWYSLKNEFIEKGISITVSNIKRNTENKIIAINIVMKSDDGREKRLDINRTEPIKAIALFSKKKTNDKWDFDVNEVNSVDDQKIKSTSEIKKVLKNNKEVVLETEKPISTIKNLETKDDNSMLLIINGKEYYQKDVKGYTYKTKGTATHLTGDEAIKIYGEKGKNGVMIIDGQTTLVKSERQTTKTIIFSNDNGDDIVYIPNENSLKIPSYPSVRLVQNPPLLIVNGVEKSNPSATLNEMDLQTVKSIRVYDQTGKETPGTEIKKIVITTK